MVRKTFKTVPFRRKRQGKTDYKKRLYMLKSGKSRLVIRRSLANINVQVIEYFPEGDKVLVNVKSKELKDFGWNGHLGNIPSAYLTGYLAGKKAVKAGVKEVIVDIGFNKSIQGSRIYGLVKGFLDAGIKVPCGEEILPNDDRVSGKHIEAYANSLDDAQLKQKFSKYLENKVDPKKISELFNTVKEKIEGAK